MAAARAAGWTPQGFASLLYLNSEDKTLRLLFQGEWTVFPPAAAYGEIWVLGNVVETVIAVAGTFVQFTGFANDGQSSNCTPDHTENHIQIDVAGIYLVVCSITVESVGGGAADILSAEIRKNNGATIFENLYAHRKLVGGGGDKGSVSISGLAPLSKDDTVELWITDDDNPANLLVGDCNLSVARLGAT